MYRHVHTYIHTYIQTYVHAYIHVYIHAYTVVHTHIHTLFFMPIFDTESGINKESKCSQAMFLAVCVAVNINSFFFYFNKTVPLGEEDRN